MTRQQSILDCGAMLLTGFLTEAEESRIIRHITESEWSSALSRRVQHYGHRYNYRGGGVSPEPAPPLPFWAAYLADRLLPRFDGVPADQCIVNEYKPGQGIGMHADHADFGPVVASISLAAAWPMRFRHSGSAPYNAGALPGDEVIVLPRRSVLVLSRSSRHDWLHGIDKRSTASQAHTRISATFRTIAT